MAGLTPTRPRAPALFNRAEVVGKQVAVVQRGIGHHAGESADQNQRAADDAAAAFAAAGAAARRNPFDAPGAADVARDRGADTLHVDPFHARMAGVLAERGFGERVLEGALKHANGHVEGVIVDRSQVGSNLPWRPACAGRSSRNA